MAMKSSDSDLLEIVQVELEPQVAVTVNAGTGAIDTAGVTPEAFGARASTS